MCIAFFWVGDGSGPYKYIVGSNRDEYLTRACTRAHPWNNAQQGHRFTFAGQDLLAKGTWLGIRAELLLSPVEQAKIGPPRKPDETAASFRFGLITNHREVPDGQKRPSRGEIITSYLSEKSLESTAEFVQRLSSRSSSYPGFNLLVGDFDGMFYVANHSGREKPERIDPGFHGMSNGALDDDWPKVVRGKKTFEDLVMKHFEKGGRSSIAGEGILIDSIFKIMANHELSLDQKLPGVYEKEAERNLSGIFVPEFEMPSAKKVYGTRSTAVIIVRTDGTVAYSEKHLEGDKQTDKWLVNRHNLIFNPELR